MAKYKRQEDQLIKYVIELKKTNGVNINNIINSDLNNSLIIEQAFDQVRSKGYGLRSPSSVKAAEIKIAVISLNKNLTISFNSELQPGIVSGRLIVRSIPFRLDFPSRKRYLPDREGIELNDFWW